MKLVKLELCGFRGFRVPIAVAFSSSYTIIDGRNGVGKSTLFDAVEYALTGKLSKYDDLSARGQTGDDYVWWGGARPTTETFVEVTFSDGGGLFTVRRDADGLVTVGPQGPIDVLTDPTTSPKDAMAQLCKATIIRDEHIARFSLDLTETKRYEFLRTVIGAVEAPRFQERANAAYKHAKELREKLSAAVERARNAVTQREIAQDNARALVPDTESVREARDRLRGISPFSSGEELGFEAVRGHLSQLSSQIEFLGSMAPPGQGQMVWDDTHLDALQTDVSRAEARVIQADAALESAQIKMRDLEPENASSAAAVEPWGRLLELGDQVGRIDGGCPLCKTQLDAARYAAGLKKRREELESLDALVTRRVRANAALEAARTEARDAREVLSAASEARDLESRRLDELERRLKQASLPKRTDPDAFSALERLKRDLNRERETVSNDLALLRSVGKNAALAEAEEALAEARRVRAEVQDRFAEAEGAEQDAKRLLDIVKRAARESFEGRIQRTMPLLQDIYRRLRPHPLWTEIDYRMRGDIRPMLTLQVGEDINPQFVFSSGQRRATGLAFLLSVNLSLAWSRWKSVLLDDPVQHIDDFRAVHLAEVLSHFVSSGRQVVCAVENPALADLLSRRLATAQVEPGLRHSLARSKQGDLAVATSLTLPHAIRRVLVTPPLPASA